MRGIGEDASIAYAADGADTVFVSMDNNGIRFALDEFEFTRVRVTRLAPFLRFASTLVPLRKDLVVEIGRRAQIDRAEPTWWRAWLETLS